MLPAWLVIAIVGILVAVAVNRLSAEDTRWFFRLRRPRWLTFERLIPLIWISIFICGGWSAYAVWTAAPWQLSTWLIMGLYVLLEVVIMAYTPVMCKLRSLKVGTGIGAAGFVLGCILALLIWPISQTGLLLLVPYLLWSPIGTFLTWKMIALNPENV
jgi:tryptophan-rich sensory protein